MEVDDQNWLSEMAMFVGSWPDPADLEHCSNVAVIRATRAALPT
jgi:hypothetical protein